MILDNFLKKYELKEVFNTELKIEKEKFIEKMKEISDISFKTKFLLIADNFLPEKIKYIGNFSKSFIELRERTFPFKRYKMHPLIKINLKNKNDLLLVNTNIQGVSYFIFFIHLGILSLLIFYCFLLLLKLNILPALLILSLIYFYLFLAVKKIKANVKRVKKELSDFYKTTE